MSQKVLIVEDDSNIAELLHLYLEKEGFETKVAKDGGKGVEYFRSFQPNLVLLDIMLPIMDGWTVLKKIREESAAPVIMLTAKGDRFLRKAVPASYPPCKIHLLKFPEEC